MNALRQNENEQAVLWNGPGGRAWVEAQEVLDRMFQPFEDLLARAASAQPGSRVLDIGCGTGSTTLAIAQALGPQGSCTGIDISEPMIDLARVRAERAQRPVRFIRANAQDHSFPDDSFDLLVSRFGVMFFDDPVQAFGNLRRAATDEAQLRLLAWRGAAENPFMTTAERAAAPLMPELPARSPGGPGQFAFADRDGVRRILTESGWRKVDIQPLEVACTLPETGLLTYVTKVGPVGRALADVDEETRARVIATVRVAFEEYVQGSEVHFTAACWLVKACGG